MNDALVAKKIAKSFKSKSVVEAVDLEVHPGEIVGLLGPNGAGKTTIFKILLGLLSQDFGEVSFGRVLDGMPLYKRAGLGLGYLPQGPSVFRGLSVKNNLLVLLEALKKKHPKKKADELLKRFGLTALSSQKAGNLSGGERRRLEFARALCSNPQILLVDEPFAGVDPLAVSEISNSILSLAADGVGVLLTDHTVREAFSICHRVYLLVEGKILESGTADDIKNSKIARRMYLGNNF